MFGSVIAKTACTTGNQIVDILHEVALEFRVFCVYIRKSAHGTGCTLIAVVVVLHNIQTVGMIQVVAATYGFDEIFCYGCCVECCVIGQYVNKNFYAVFFRFVAHGFEFFTCAELIVSDLPVNRLVVEIPFAGVISAENVFSAVVADKAGVCRGCLYISIACFGNVLHVFFDRIERPAPRM